MLRLAKMVAEIMGTRRVYGVFYGHLWGIRPDM